MVGERRGRDRDERRRVVVVVGGFAEVVDSLRVVDLLTEGRDHEVADLGGRGVDVTGRSTEHETSCKVVVGFCVNVDPLSLVLILVLVLIWVLVLFLVVLILVMMMLLLVMVMLVVVRSCLVHHEGRRWIRKGSVVVVNVIMEEVRGVERASEVFSCDH